MLENEKTRSLLSSIAPLWLLIVLIAVVMVLAIRIYNQNLATTTGTNSSSVSLLHAIDEFEKATRLEPSSQQMYQELANVYSIAGQQDAIIRVWNRAIQKNSDKLWPYRNLTGYYGQLNKTEEEILVWKDAIEKNPDQKWPYENLSSVYKSMSLHNEGSATWKRAIWANPTEIWPRINLARYYSNQNQRDSALEVYAKAVEDFPRNSELHFAYANRLIQKQNWEMGISYLESAVSLSPTNAPYLRQLGKIQIEQGQLTEGIGNLEQLLSLEPNETNFQLLRGQYEQHNIQGDTLISRYSRILDGNPENILVRTALINSYLERMDCPQAIDLSEKGVALSNDAAGHLSLVSVQELCTSIERTIETYIDGLAVYPNSYELNFGLAITYLQGKQLRNSIPLFIKSLQSNESYKSYQDIRNAIVSHLPAEEALTTLEAILAGAGPHIHEPYEDLASRFQVLDQTEESLAVWEIAVRANSDSTWPLEKQGQIYQGLNELPEALTKYQKAIDIAPDEASLHFIVGQLFSELKNFGSAKQSFQRAIMLSPENRRYQLGLGHTHLELGSIAEGVQVLEALYVQSEYNDKIYQQIRLAYKQALDWPTAQPFQESLALLRWPNDHVTAYRSLANWYLSIDELEAAEFTYQKSITLDSTDLATLIQLKNLYLAKSDCKSASKYALQAADIQASSITYLQLADVYAICGPPEALQIAQQRSVENYLIEQTPQSNKRNVVDRTVQRYRDTLTEQQVIAYLTDALTTLELDRAEPYIQLGWYYETSIDPPNPQQALIHYQQAAKAVPNSFKAAAAVGRLLHDGGVPEEALTHYRKAILLNQSDQSVRVRYGRALVESGEVEQGEAVLASALQLEQSDWYTSYALEGYIMSLPSAAALRFITETLTLVPSNSEEVYMPSVRYYLGIGDTGAVVDILTLASESNPKLGWPHVKLSYIYRGLQEVDLAVEQMKVAIQKEPRVAWNHNDLGLFYRENGDVDSALLSLAQAVILEPKNAWYHIYYGQALLENGQSDRGNEQLVLALEVEQTEEVYAFVDTLFTKHLSAEHAQDTYQFLIESNPENEVARQYLLSRSEE